MKQCRFIAVILCLIIFGSSLVRAQDMDTEISKLTEDLAAKISNKQCKKVSVVDFTDLEDNSTELGKYVADQMTVDFAMTNRDFSVLDRAHLKKIMDEHKLTSSGLVDPENAKQLGMLAGVDALIFGKVVQIGKTISVTVEVISTDTGSVFTAGKAKFQQDDSTQQLVAKSDADDNSSRPKVAIPVFPSQTNGNLVVSLTRMRTLNDSFNGRWYQVDLIFRNISTQNQIAVAMLHQGCMVEPCELETVLVSGDGMEFPSYDNGLMGINALRSTPLRLTAIEPGGQMKASIKFEKRQNISPTVTSFSFRSTIVVNQNYNATSYDNYRVSNNVVPPPYCELASVIFDFPVKTNAN